MSAEAMGRDELGPVDRLLRDVAQDPVQRVTLGLRLGALRAGGAVEPEIAALREELHALRAQLAGHTQRLTELEAFARGMFALLHSGRETEAPAELSAEEQAELDRLADWPFLDEYPPIAHG